MTRAPASAPGRAERNKREKRERIMRAARELFRKHGFEATTVSQIAERADVGKGTLFLYAGSKEELLVMFFREDVGRSMDRGFNTVPDAPLLEQVMHVFGVMLDQNRRNLDLGRTFAKEVPFVGGDRHAIAEVMSGFYDRMSMLIEQAQARGEVPRQVAPRGLAHNLFALYFFMLLGWLGGSLAGAPEATLRAMLEVQFFGLGNAANGERRRRKTANPR
jgi:AcrR family transcriptional regulator